ncbi:hypothetical protein ACN47E_005623 [Coniothyrium glycines]
MPSLGSRAAEGTQLSTTTVAAIIAGTGIVLLGLLGALIYLLVRAVRTHKQLLKDLEERGVTIAEAQKEARREALSKPRAVLRRNTILPFNSTTGWGTLTSVETIRSAEASNVPAHYVPPMPTGPVKRTNVLAWPFSSRKSKGHAVQMKKLKGSRLSTVIESPQASPLGPMLSSSNLLSSRPSLAIASDYGSRATSSQSLLKYHPAYRAQPPIAGSAASSPRPENASSTRENRLQRARSMAEVPSLQAERPQLRVRSASLCTQNAGKVPDVILPPLPLDIARIKDEAKRRSQLRHMPSKQSISSVGSVDSTILATRPSPVVPQSAKFRGQKITKPNAKGSSFAGGRTFRDTLDLRNKVRAPRDSLQFIPTQAKPLPAVEIRELPVRHVPQPESSSQPRDLINRSRPSSIASPMVSPRNPRTTPTAKRRSRTMVSSAGSPERQFDGLIHSGSMTRSVRSPKRQHSQTSSRSSGGNPFQWDPSPLISSAGKPSALKGSPSARQGHRRKNSVRISLVPIIHGLPNQTQNLPTSNGATDEPMEKKTTINSNGLGLTSRALPTPPASVKFEPELKSGATSIKASLTTSSTALPLVEYDQSYVVFPTDTILPHLSERELKRLSNGSIFSLSRFPNAPSVIEVQELDTSESHMLPSKQSHDFHSNWMPETPLIQQNPFGMQTPERQNSPEQRDLIGLDEYDPERPSCVYQTPPAKNAPVPYKSACTTIIEESSVNSNKTIDVNQKIYGDSPPVSPKTISPPRFTLDNNPAYRLPIHSTMIPEDTSDTIDPALLSKDNFLVLNSSVDDISSSFYRTPNSSRLSLIMPRTASSMLEPLIANNVDSPTIGHTQSRQSSSEYSSRSLSPSPGASPIELPSPVFPCSPRPAHAELPLNRLSINFSEMPRLTPSPRGPRGSPPRPLRSSIAQLRRMNSDAADAKKEKAGRGERRYLRLGREDSMQVPGDESWLDELEDSNPIELDEAEGRRLVGSVLEEWDEGHAVLDLNNDDDTEAFPSTSAHFEPASVTVVEADTTAGASQRISSIWEDGEKYWSDQPHQQQHTPPRPGSPNKPKDYHYQPLASSPLTNAHFSPPASRSSSSNSPNRKRHFDIAKDDPPSQEDCMHPYSPSSPQSKQRHDNNSNDNRRNGVVGGRYRKRNALGTATTNVRIQVTSPGGSVMGTPGSLYDAQGFLNL